MKEELRRNWAQGQKKGENRVVQYTVTEAKNKLAELIRLAQDGEAVTVTRYGEPCVDLVKSKPLQPAQRKFGILGSKRVVLDPDWDKPIENIDAWMKGEL